jgi:predicted TIM-barrel fold metal-dependent hydrolase
MTSHKSAAQLRAELGHPVIDNDGHILEIVPVLAEFVREVGGPSAVDRYIAATRATEGSRFGKHFTTAEERADGWVGKTSWWSHTTNTYDRATSTLPRLFAERLGELGIDFAVLYPTDGLYANRIEGDDELRQIVCRAVNLYQVELFKGCERQLAPVAVIPMATPAEALDELDHAVGTLGYKTVLLTSGVRRPVAKVEREHPDAAHLARRVDFYGIDSVHDYDPVWHRCVELGVPVTFHGQTVGTWVGPVSVSNNSFNRLSVIGNNYPALLLALLLGGVVDRFPRLKFVFQEGGAGWMTALYAQLLGVWEKRNGAGIGNFDPARLDVTEFARLVEKYGGERERRHLDWVAGLTQDLATPETLDEFALVGADTAEELRDLFVSHFYAGCEADDWTNAHAFAGNPLGAVLKTTFGSDIGHWDVLEANDVLPEAFELVEDGALSPEQLRAFLFDNAAELYTSMNPSFFAGTVLEDAVAVEAPLSAG